MGRARREMAFLQRRQATWYIRFRLPTRLRPLAARTEIRISLGTKQLSFARERAERVLSHVYSIKQLARRMSALEQEHIRKALDLAFSRIVDELERTKEPWLRERSRSMFGLPLVSAATVSPKIPGSDRPFEAIRADLELIGLRSSIERNDHTRGVATAREFLARVGGPVDEESPLFRHLAVELLKLKAMYVEAQKARAFGDFSKEEEYIQYYLRRGYQATPTAAVSSMPRLSKVWVDYAREKVSALPKPQWSEKTAEFQEATFAEFIEIVGDRRLDEVSRDTILKYADVLQQLPKNRRKIHGDKSIAELLALNLPKAVRPSERTLAEKLIRIKAFLDWCRITKGAPATDPTERITFRVESQSYAPFSQSDLIALFTSPDYRNGAHATSWRFWMPLMALYTAARQAEIAQLTLSDIRVEDDIPFISISSHGEGQHVKTTAGIRRVPISSKLQGLGFLDYVASLRQRGESRLFPELRRKEGNRTDTAPVSKWFNESYLSSCGVERQDPSGRRKVFHSFRHTAITKALSAGTARLAHCQQVFGHEKTLFGETATYIAPFSVETLVPVVEALDFGLDHSAYLGSWKSYAKALR